jgi:replication-associated recombination protein RarA
MLHSSAIQVQVCGCICVYKLSLRLNTFIGKTTVARHYAAFLGSVKALPGSVFEETTGALLSHKGVDALEAIITKVVNGGGGVIFIDEAYQLTNEGGSGRMVLDAILTEMENRAGTIAFIFAGYNKEMEKFFQHNPGLPSRVPYTMKFEDYTDTEFTKMFEQLVLKKYNGRMKVEDEVDGIYTKIVIRRLASGRDRPGFGNARSLQLVFQKVTERQAIRVTKERRAGNRVDDFFLSKEDLIGPDPSQAILKSKAWTELQCMIGLDAVKKSVKQMVDMLSVNYKRELEDKKPLDVPLNRVFLGSPGTGKTTVGKLYGQILADIGMLSNGEGTQVF